MRSEQIFDALLCDESLADLTTLLAKAAGGRSSHIGWGHADGTFDLLSHKYFDPADMQSYAQSWMQKDPWVQAYFKPQNTHKLIPAHWLVPDAVFAKSEMYNDFILAQGDDTFRAAGASVATPEFQGFFAVERPRTAQDFEASDLDPLRPLLPDLIKLLQVRGELGAARRRANRAEAALDTLALATLTVKADGRCLHMNEAAAQVMARQDGLTLRQGRLVATDLRRSKLLLAAIAGATGASAPHAMSLIIERAPPLRPYRLTVTPLRAGSGPALAIIVFRDPDSTSGSTAAQLRQLFGLSATEASLAVSLAEGMTPDEMAEARRVSLNTIRTQLRAVSDKMGCNRLAQVAALVGSLPPT